MGFCVQHWLGVSALHLHPSLLPSLASSGNSTKHKPLPPLNSTSSLTSPVFFRPIKGGKSCALSGSPISQILALGSTSHPIHHLVWITPLLSRSCFILGADFFVPGPGAIYKGTLASLGDYSSFAFVAQEESACSTVFGRKDSTDSLFPSPLSVNVAENTEVQLARRTWT